MKKHYDQKAVVRKFHPCDKFLVLFPKLGSSLETKFSGPYIIEKKSSETITLSRLLIAVARLDCHGNMMKLYH